MNASSNAKNWPTPESCLWKKATAAANRLITVRLIPSCTIGLPIRNVSDQLISALSNFIWCWTLQCRTCDCWRLCWNGFHRNGYRLFSKIVRNNQWRQQMETVGQRTSRISLDYFEYRIGLIDLDNTNINPDFIKQRINGEYGPEDKILCRHKFFA